MWMEILIALKNVDKERQRYTVFAEMLPISGNEKWLQGKKPAAIN